MDPRQRSDLKKEKTVTSRMTKRAMTAVCIRPRGIAIFARRYSMDSPRELRDLLAREKAGKSVRKSAEQRVQSGGAITEAGFSSEFHEKTRHAETRML